MQENNIVQLVPITSEDFHQLSEYFFNYMKEIDEDYSFNKKNCDDFLQAVFTSSKRELFWTLKNNSICGFTFLLLEKNWPDMQSYKGRVSEFYILPELRRRNFGKLVFEEITRYFISKNCNKIELEVHFKNESGFAFWKAMGFELKKYLLKKTLTI